MLITLAADSLQQSFGDGRGTSLTIRIALLRLLHSKLHKTLAHPHQLIPPKSHRDPNILRNRASERVQQQDHTERVDMTTQIRVHTSPRDVLTALADDPNADSSATATALGYIYDLALTRSSDKPAVDSGLPDEEAVEMMATAWHDGTCRCGSKSFRPASRSSADGGNSLTD